MLKATSDPASSTEASIASTFTLQRVIVSCHATSQSDIVSRLTKKPRMSQHIQRNSEFQDNGSLQHQKHQHWTFLSSQTRLSEVIFDFKSFCLGFACWLTMFASSLCKYTQVTKIGKWSQKLSENHEILQVSRQKSLPHLSRSSMGWCLSHPNVSDFTKAPLFKRSMGCDAWAFFCLEKWR